MGCLPISGEPLRGKLASCCGGRLLIAAILNPLGDRTVRPRRTLRGKTEVTSANDQAIRRALETAGVEFIDDGGGGAGVRLRQTRTPIGGRRHHHPSRPVSGS